MTISSSSGGEMEEFKERVSDIITSPVIRKIWQFKYRHWSVITLVLILSFVSLVSYAADSRVSRLFLVTSLYERVYNRQLTELEAINTGLLDAYEDGRYHLDWPVSRGMAAEAFYRLSRQAGTVARFPRAFADIDRNSRFKKMLDVVGGAFLPQRRGNFDPNHVLARPDLLRGINALIDKGVFKQEDRYAMEIEIINKPLNMVATASSDDLQIDSIRPELGFADRKKDGQQFSNEAYDRFAKAEGHVALEHLNPQVMSSIEDAADAMQDVEKLLESLGGSVLEMTDIYPSNPDDERALREGLSKIEGLLKVITERFKYAKLQLGTVMPINAEQTSKCAALQGRLEKSLDEAAILRKRIAGRLAEPEKGKEP
jgi:hypothetical protein